MPFAPDITQTLIDKAVAFHGHWCPGLSLGIRVSVWAIRHLGTATDEDIVAVTETDMCAVDAIQALVGCTLGKGNLIFRDEGKVAFSFFRRKDGKRARLVQKLQNVPWASRKQELRERLSVTKSDAERRILQERLDDLRHQDIQRILTLPFEELFYVKEPAYPMPPMAPRLSTIPCESCGEGVMSSRICLVHGRNLCRSCAELEKHPDGRHPFL